MIKIKCSPITFSFIVSFNFDLISLFGIFGQTDFIFTFPPKLICPTESVGQIKCFDVPKIEIEKVTCQFQNPFVITSGYFVFSQVHRKLLEGIVHCHI